MFAHMPMIRDILFIASRYGAYLGEMCTELGLDPSKLNDSSIRVDFQTAARTWEVALDRTREPLLGLRLGESTNPSIMGIIGHLMQSAPTLRVAFEKVNEFSALVTDMFTYELKVTKGEVHLTYRPAAAWIKSSPDGAQHAIDQAMAGTLQVFEFLSGKRVLPLRVTMTRSRLMQRREYERVLGRFIAYSAKSDTLAFAEAQLNVPVVSYDESLFASFERMVKEKMNEASAQRTTIDKLEIIVHRDFGGRVPPVSALATVMNLSVRTLQRNLSEEGMDFRSWSTQFKRSLAEKLLKGNQHRIKEVASFLGYADASSFRRARKGWK